MAGTIKQLNGLFRTLGAGSIVWERWWRQFGPCLLDGGDDLPLRLDLVAAGKQRGVTAHGVEDERLIGDRSIAAKGLRVGEPGHHRNGTHMRSRALGSEGERDAFIGLDAQADDVGANAALGS